MGCSCSKEDLLPGSRPTSVKAKKSGGALQSNHGGESASHHHSHELSKNGSLPLHKRVEGPLPSISTATTTPNRISVVKQVQQSSLSSGPSRRGGGSRSSPSTPSTVLVDDDDDEEHHQRRQQPQLDDQRDNNVNARHQDGGNVDNGEEETASAGGTTTATSAYHQLGDPSEHYESDAEDQRFSQVKDDIQQDLKHLFDLEEEVKLESRQLIHDIDHSTSTHADDDNNDMRMPAAPRPKPTLNVLFTGDDAGYLMNLLRLTSGPTFTKDERQVLRDTIRSNVVEHVRVLCRNLREADFESFLVYHEDNEDESHQQQEQQQAPADLFDTLQLFGQLKNAWQDIRAQDSHVQKDASSNGNRLKAREAYEILLSMLLVEDDDEGDDPTKENVDMYEEEKESIEDTKLFLNLWREIQALWQSDELKEFLSERPWLLHDSLLFHLSIMEDLTRVAAPDYSVTDEDILDASNGDRACTCERCTVHLESVVLNVTCISLSHLEQHGLQSLDKPHIVAFVASLTGFDQTHGEEGVNKMMRSIGSLRALCGMEASQRECVTCVVLTKQDLFAEKMRYSDVAAIADFDDFEGESGDTDGAFDYFIDKFQSCLPSRSDDLVVPFDPETSDVATILQDYAKRFRGPAQSNAETVTSQSAYKQASLVVEQSKPSAAIEVTYGDGEEFYTETIEV